MNVAFANFMRGTPQMIHYIDYALELFDTKRDESQVRYRLMIDFKLTRQQAEEAIQKAKLDSRSKATTLET
jgi:hypothetical protein